MNGKGNPTGPAMPDFSLATHCCHTRPCRKLNAIRVRRWTLDGLKYAYISVFNQSSLESGSRIRLYFCRTAVLTTVFRIE
jgi:hypothetical protein